MSIRNLEYLFQPRSIALIGASRKEHSVGAVVARNLVEAGFEGPVMPVNPRHPEIQGLQAYPDVESLPQAPDLAVIATPPATVPGIVQQLGERGTRAAVVITAGFGEGESGHGQELRQELLEAARPNLVRIVGPNIFGIYSSAVSLDATFGPGNIQPGSVAIITQSGALGLAMIGKTSVENIGLSAIVSVGNKCDVDEADLLDYLADQPDGHPHLSHHRASAVAVLGSRHPGHHVPDPQAELVRQADGLRSRLFPGDSPS